MEAVQETRYATRTLPDHYRPAGVLDLSRDWRALVAMNLLGVGLLIGAGWIFSEILFWLRPQETANFNISFSFGSSAELFEVFAAALGIVIAVIVLHEAAHGLFFWLFTRDRPVFRFTGLYASASAPGWYIRRTPYLVIGLAPLVLLSFLGVALLAVLPPGWFIAVLLFLTLNASGAVGDLMVVGWLLSKPVETLTLDRPNSIHLFIPPANRS
ncbi:MAG: DUF3267 domain-containing protein [Chloroflexi bacterium]|jgi:hypothetical protein|nr:DUF3267 domain-containing protein [Anaerolineaceae bacterium]NMB87538.1 DUF3267 domain-containing protein [Chloroflexota bacterium]